MKSFGKSVSDFFDGLKPEFKLPKEIQFMLPYEDAGVRRITRDFYSKYFDDNKKRIFILGINPGRLGAGLTGIAFTDPIRLEEKCGIKNSIQKKPELSSSFIYEMIDGYGGVKSFYNDFFLTAICPIGFTKDGKNINYYDERELLISVKDFISRTIIQQIEFGANKNVAICLGEGKNFAFFSKLNDEKKLFKEIIALPHPRFIMQYKRKQVEEYQKKYLEVLTAALDKN